MDREPRWTIRVDGDSIEFALRAGAPMVEWARTMWMLLVWLTIAVVLIVLVAQTALRGLGDHDRALKGWGELLVWVAIASYPAVCLATELLWLSWLLTGREVTVIGSTSVNTSLDAVCIHRRSERPKHPHAEPFALPTNRHDVRRTLRSWRSRTHDVGGLGMMDPHGVCIPFGIDLTLAEGEAVLAELALIRRAMGLPDRGPPPPEPDAGGAQPAPPRGKVQRAVDRLARSAGRAVGWAVLRRAPGPRGR
ncbi:MAG: hypothetical protein K8T90_05805 [Planctomycetes bacterium]|nr:hypothetical protein [Planctomycetota bacterium]